MEQSMSEEEASGEGFLRYQVLLTLLALDVLGFGAGHAHVRGEGTVLQEIVEGIQVIGLREGDKWKFD